MDILTSSTIGRRVERLLYGGAVLVALAFVAFYLASAARHYEENRASLGFESLALLIEGDDQVLQRFYELEAQRQKLVQKKKEAAGENFYLKALEDKIGRAAALSGAAPQALRALVSEHQPPEALVKRLREQKKDFDERPATVAGMVVPNAALGTRLPAAFVATVLLIALGPVIVFWLGALRASRAREHEAFYDGDEPYPHALNGLHLPLGALLDRASRRWPVLASRDIEDRLAAVGRIVLLAMLIVPLIGAYVAALATLGAGAEGPWLRALYTIVIVAVMLVQTVALLAGEVPPRAAREPEAENEDQYDDEDSEDEAPLREEPRLRR